jgi:nitrate reductase / nitrite oxidoreductase, alpha subunit
MAMAMGHVVLKEFFVDRQVPRFVDYVKRFTDLPFLLTLEARGDAYTPGKFLTADDLGETSEGAQFKTVLVDAATGEPRVPGGSLGFRFTESGKGRWNLDLEDVDPLLSLFATGGTAVPVDLPRFDAPRGEGDVLRRGVPVRRPGVRPGLGSPAAPDDSDGVLVPAH